EKKNIIVPVTREELVIEKVVFEGDTQNKTESSTETIRIPLREERVKVTKEPVILEDVQIHRNRHDEKKHIEEILRREQLSIKNRGNVKIRYKDGKVH
ncbi:MAG: YsnF/AvaK domain-containing protein, partial [Bacillota bacterium]|nr:YsnF/AvaK domain-containing protein [Bacillota bacterium]